MPVLSAWRTDCTLKVQPLWNEWQLHNCRKTVRHNCSSSSCCCCCCCLRDTVLCRYCCGGYQVLCDRMLLLLRNRLNCRQQPPPPHQTSTAKSPFGPTVSTTIATTATTTTATATLSPAPHPGAASAVGDGCEQAGREQASLLQWGTDTQATRKSRSAGCSQLSCPRTAAWASPGFAILPRPCEAAVTLATASLSPPRRRIGAERPPAE